MSLYRWNAANNLFSSFLSVFTVNKNTTSSSDTKTAIAAITSRKLNLSISFFAKIGYKSEREMIVSNYFQILCSGVESLPTLNWEMRLFSLNLLQNRETSESGVVFGNNTEIINI